MSGFLDDWSYELPDACIARHPVTPRDAARMMTVPRGEGALGHRHVRDLADLLEPGDLLVANDSKVMPARLSATRATGGKVEVLVLSAANVTPCLLKPARRLKRGEVLEAPGGRIVIEALPDAEGIARVRLEPDALALLESGAMPLPPYLGRDAEPEDLERYQTVYSGPLGSSAAPTAGLHFTPDLLERLGSRGVGFTTVTLHVGIGTFRPLRPEDVARGELHPEWWQVSEAASAAIAQTRAKGGRIIAVGTTSTRVLESAVQADGTVPAGAGETRLFVQPPYTPRAVDGLLTNFHLPRSSLMMLVATLCGRERLLAAYRTAVSEGYRFYSYGDAMLLL